MFKVITLITAATIALSVGSGCQTSDVVVKPIMKKLVPVVVCLLVDGTGSYSGHPVIDSTSLAKLIKAVSERGGVLSVGVITEASFSPLLSARLELDTLPLIGNLQKRANLHQINLARAEEHYGQQRRFFDQVWEKLSAPRDAKQTDIFGGISRARILLEQPSLVNHDAILLLATDGAHNVADSHFEQLPKSCEIWTVGWPRAKAAEILSHPVTQFESLQFLVSHLAEIRLLQEGPQAATSVAVMGN